MKRSIISALVLSTLFSAPSFAFLNFGSDDQQQDLAGMVSNTLNQAESNSSLITQVTNQLPVSAQQATGGVGAMLSLAQNQLSDSNSQELGQLLPGMDQLTNLNLSGSKDMLSGINNLSAVNDAFKGLGLDPSMISQFAPLVLQYLTSQGASDGLLGSLSNLWGTSATQ